MRVLLFALTGFGNKVLDALLEESCEVKFLFTRKEKGPFPYYNEENLGVYANKKGIKVYDDFCWADAEEIIKDYSPELFLVSTFHRIIPEKILSKVPYCINIHPSLLPKYKGPTPIDWALFNKEKVTGVTAHFLTKELDSGDILIQKKIFIKKDDNKNTLMKRLAILSAEAVRELINQLRVNALRPVPQDLKQATYFPKFNK